MIAAPCVVTAGPAGADLTGPRAPFALADSAAADSAAAPDSAGASRGAAAPAGDGRAAADTAAADSVRGRPTGRPGAATAGAARRVRAAAGPFSEPRWVMLRSAVFPGWGQAYNRQWWKAGVVAAVEIGMAYRIYDDNRALDDLERQAAEAAAAGDAELQNALALRYNDRLDTMVARQWLLAGVIVYALLDAYVDAHFRGFDVEFETDPALPEDASAATGARAGLRWSF